jgi:hypothetical protein
MALTQICKIYPIGEFPAEFAEFVTDEQFRVPPHRNVRNAATHAPIRSSTV